MWIQKPTPNLIKSNTLCLDVYNVCILELPHVNATVPNSVQWRCCTLNTMHPMLLFSEISIPLYV